MEQYEEQRKVIRRKDELAQSVLMAPIAVYMVVYFVNSDVSFPPLVFHSLIVIAALIFTAWLYIYIRKYSVKCPQCGENFFSIKQTFKSLFTFKRSANFQKSCCHCSLPLSGTIKIVQAQNSK